MAELFESGCDVRRVVPPQIYETIAVLKGEMMFKKRREPATQERMLAALAVLRAWPGGVTIGYLRDKVTCGRDELSTALKNLREEGFAENPTRGHWRAVRDDAPLPPDSAGVADSYAEIHARAIAAEERAQGLAEKLAEERATSKRHLDLWSGCCDSFEQLAHVRVRLTKKVQRMRARLQELEAILADIDTIKDPTIPF